MSRQDWVDRGSFIPFPEPIPVPNTGIGDTPQVNLCFNYAWQPAILGALKSLARTETWDGTEAETQDAQREAFSIPAMLHDGCGAEIISANWHYYIGYSGVYELVNLCNPEQPVIWSASQFVFPGNYYRFAVNVARNSDNLIVGADFSQIDVMCENAMVGYVTYTYCESTPPTDTVVFPQGVTQLGPKAHLKSIQIDYAGQAFSILMRGNALWTCGPV